LYCWRSGTETGKGATGVLRLVEVATSGIGSIRSVRIGTERWTADPHSDRSLDAVRRLLKRGEPVAYEISRTDLLLGHIRQIPIDSGEELHVSIQTVLHRLVDDRVIGDGTLGMRQYVPEPDRITQSIAQRRFDDSFGL
jgi:hypothetical protein